jgi:transcriptional regulator of NAD metabolism
MTDAKRRRNTLLEKLKEAGRPVTGSQLAKELGVSRQVIVGDFAILRAAGVEVYATPQGYVLPLAGTAKVMRATLACKHGKEELEDELAVILDNGGKVLDVVVEHPIYGEIKANLMLFSRHDLELFIKKLEYSKAAPLSAITGGVHLHTVEVENREALARIEDELKIRGLLISS